MSTRKAFDPIHGDYDFFLSHATEAEAVRSACLRWLTPLKATPGPLRFLDFGCGDGSVSAALHQAWGYPADALHITLVEPDAGYRQTCQTRLTPFTTAAITALAQEEELAGLPFDIILAQHCLYYVPDLPQTVAHLYQHLAPGGLWLAILGGQANTLCQYWYYAFELMGRPVPYYWAPDFAQGLHQQGIPYHQEAVPSQLVFVDTVENRQKILRFLLHDWLNHLPLDRALAFFDRYHQDGMIRIANQDELFVIQRSR